MLQIVISKDFAKSVGARTREDGPYSGQQFYEELLEPMFLKAKDAKEKLTINFDGGYGYSPSFIDESFGHLGRQYGEQTVLNTLLFISEDEPSLIDGVKKKIRGEN